MHVTVDAQGRPGSTWSRKGCNEFCRQAVSLAGMTLIAGPTAKVYQRLQVSGYAVLAESHVSVHLDKHTRAASVDLFSCREFDWMAFVALSVEHFGLDRRTLRLSITSRGLPMTSRSM